MTKKDLFFLEKNIIIGAIYKPPNGDLEEFSESMTKIIDKVTKGMNFMYLMDDYNINLLNVDSHVPPSQFINRMYIHSLIPLIT